MFYGKSKRTATVVAGISILIVACSFTTVSPMATLMKGMLAYLQKEKKAIVANKKKNPAPANYTDIYTAAITEGKKLAPEHKELSRQLLNNLSNYHTAASGDRKTQFNLVVQSCVACHSKVCPGPIEAIEQNLIE